MPGSAAAAAAFQRILSITHKDRPPQQLYTARLRLYYIALVFEFTHKYREMGGIVALLFIFSNYIYFVLSKIKILLVRRISIQVYCVS